MMLKNLGKIVQTVRYMTVRQWKYRIYYTARNKLVRRYPEKCSKPIEFSLISLHYNENILNSNAVKTADEICAGRIPTISGIVIQFKGDWDLKDEKYRLVSFRLNSFRWLLELSDAFKVTGDKRYIDVGFMYIKDWQRKCGCLISGDKWNPYVIAERLTNWIGFCSEYGDRKELKEIVTAIYSQAQELNDSLEYQLGANHLLSEAKALLLAGFFLTDSHLYIKGKALLFEESKEQFLADGGHYERSVSYHVESLQQLFEAYAVMKFKSDPDADLLAEIMKEPYCFLNGMISVNGKIPLYNDAAYDYPFYDATDFLNTSMYVFDSAAPKGREGDYCRRWIWLGKGNKHIEWEDKTKYEQTGFVHYQFTAKGVPYSLFVDCGDNGPDYNLGHTHADALSIILSSCEKDILVDSGVFTYKAGKERDACRATKAHNTVEVSGRNNAEVWSAFRVARRGHTKISGYSEEKGMFIRADHDGYIKCNVAPIVHTREITIVNGHISILDIMNTEDEFYAVARLHISPDCTVTLVDRYACLIDNQILIQSEKTLNIVDCQVASEFGVVEKTKCIEIDFQGARSLQTEILLE